MADLIAQGADPQNRWRRPLAKSRSTILGRGAGGWATPWDDHVSRQHAEIVWDGQRLHVRQLASARNPIFIKGRQSGNFDILPGEHPIVPIMIGDAVKAQQLSQRILELGIYAVGFFFPVVPKGQARIRVQMSAVHDRHHLEKAVAAFTQAGRELGLVGAAQ